VRSGFGGRRVTAKDPEIGRLLTLYTLCKEFGKLPSEIEEENERTMNQFLIFIDERNKQEKMRMKKMERKMKRRRR
jgi:hypothetical protein